MAFLWGPFLSGSEGAPQAGEIPRPGHPPSIGTYVGMDVCATCHSDITAAHKQSGMAKALLMPLSAEILIDNPRMTMRSGPFTFTIVRDGSRSIYSVTDGKNTLSVPILYALGQGKAGQTYVYKHNEAYYESRVSYYTSIKGLDITIGATPPASGMPLDEALGKLTSADDIRTCLGCHTTAAVRGKDLHVDKLVPGVNCEACHGPGGDHVAAMKAGDFKNPKIFNPGHLDGDALTQEFCGKCHRSAEEVILSPKQSTAYGSSPTGSSIASATATTSASAASPATTRIRPWRRSRCSTTTSVWPATRRRVRVPKRSPRRTS
jgi:hypothetical protein